MPKLTQFIGRKQELKDLNAFLDKKSASFIVMTGRRRVGKSRLISEFTKGHRCLKFTGLAPSNEVTAQHQRNLFSAQLAEQTGLPEFESDDWHKLFNLLARETKNHRVIIVLDEISWMGSKDETFLAKLKVAWDDYFSQNPELMLIVCGSVSTWINKNILSSTGYFGRISHQFHLEPLTLPESNQMLEAIGFKRSTYEKARILAVTGNIPWYLEHIQPNLSADDNIKMLGFRRGSLFRKEFDKIFHDLFESRGSIYKSITMALSNGSKTFDQLCDELNYAKSGTMTDYLDELIQAGFIKREYTWNLENGKKSRLNKYRLSDNYLRFYLKCIHERIDKIDRDLFAEAKMTSIPGFDGIMGLQFENLILNNRNQLLKKLNIHPEQLVQDGPYFQRKTTRQAGTQIDYLIQTSLKTLFIFEIKCSINPITPTVTSEIEEKIKALKLSRNQACLPVLIHINGVTDSLLEKHYFHKLIDFADLLDSD